jgi:hypothetical protein
MHPVVDGPGVPGRAGARGHAGHDGVERFAAEPVAGDGGGIAHLDDADLGALDGPRAGRTGADEAHHVMPAPRQRAQRRATGGAGGAKETDADRPGGVGWIVSGHAFRRNRFHGGVFAICTHAPSSRGTDDPVRGFPRLCGRPPAG